ncbi:Hypothetical predicted protein, partial [Paramuricea clavata]
MPRTNTSGTLRRRFEAVAKRIAEAFDDAAPFVEDKGSRTGVELETAIAIDEDLRILLKTFEETVEAFLEALAHLEDTADERHRVQEEGDKILSKGARTLRALVVVVNLSKRPTESSSPTSDP